jgi:hypothetical protein
VAPQIKNSSMVPRGRCASLCSHCGATPAGLLRYAICPLPVAAAWSLGSLELRPPPPLVLQHCTARRSLYHFIQFTELPRSLGAPWALIHLAAANTGTPPGNIAALKNCEKCGGECARINITHLRIKLLPLTNARPRPLHNITVTRNGHIWLNWGWPLCIWLNWAYLAQNPVLDTGKWALESLADRS